MDVLISNNVKAETSQKVKDIVHMYCIQPCTSEPHHQHQNHAECCTRQNKGVMNCILTFTGAPNNLWILCLIHVVFILNITANSNIGDISPHQYLYGQTPDTSPTVCFQFYKPVYYSEIDSFPAPVDKKGAGLVLLLVSGIPLPFTYLPMIPIALSIVLLFVLR